MEQVIEGLDLADGLVGGLKHGIVDELGAERILRLEVEAQRVDLAHLGVGKRLDRVFLRLGRLRPEALDGEFLALRPAEELPERGLADKRDSAFSDNPVAVLEIDDDADVRGPALGRLGDTRKDGAADAGKDDVPDCRGACDHPVVNPVIQMRLHRDRGKGARKQESRDEEKLSVFHGDS